MVCLENGKVKIPMGLRIFVFAASIVAVVSQMNNCSSTNTRTHGDCIKVLGCAWCFQKSFAKNRCQPVRNISSACDAVHSAHPRRLVKRFARCGLTLDADCILECREGVNNEDEIPDICDCYPTRPVLYINEAELERLSSLDTRQYYESVANTRLAPSTTDGSFEFNTDGCVAKDKDNCDVDYVILDNAIQFVIVAVRQRVCSNAPHDSGSSLCIPAWILAVIISSYLSA